MSQSIFSVKQESELKKEIHDLIKKGLSFPPIKAALENKFDYVREKNGKQVTDFIDEMISNFKGYKFIQNVKKSTIISAHNSKTMFLYNDKTKSKEFVAEPNIIKLCKFEWMANLLPCTTRYLPNTTEDIILTDDDSYIFNTYQPPAWYKDYHYDRKQILSDGMLPEVYRSFFHHLFNGDQITIEYVLDWMACAIKHKNQCYLTAISLQGTGKGILGNILKELVGHQNFVTMPFTSITKQFNSQFAEKKIIYLDEVKVKTREQEDILKILVNEFIEIERKNHDAGTVQNFASLYLSSNDLASLKITNDDRRYSIVNMSDAKYNSVFTEQDRLKLFEENNIRALGSYLFNRPLDLDSMSKPFTSVRTKLVKAAALSDWEDAILNSIAITEQGKKLTLIALKDKLNHELGRTINIGNKAIKELELKFPNFFIFKREFQPDGRKIFMIDFLPLTTQPRHLIENIDVSLE